MLSPFGIFYCHLVGITYGHLWSVGIFLLFWYAWTKNNLAILLIAVFENKAPSDDSWLNAVWPDSFMKKIAQFAAQPVLVKTIT
jgi:hypothetical protein